MNEYTLTHQLNSEFLEWIYAHCLHQVGSKWKIPKNRNRPMTNTDIILLCSVFLLVIYQKLYILDWTVQLLL